MKNRNVLQITKNSKGRRQVRQVSEQIVPRSMHDLDTRVQMIQALIPVGLEAVKEELDEAVTALAGHDQMPHEQTPAGLATPDDIFDNICNVV